VEETRVVQTERTYGEGACKTPQEAFQQRSGIGGLREPANIIKTHTGASGLFGLRGPPVVMPRGSKKKLRASFGKRTGWDGLSWDGRRDRGKRGEGKRVQHRNRAYMK